MFQLSRGDYPMLFFIINELYMIISKFKILNNCPKLISKIYKIQSLFNSPNLNHPNRSQTIKYIIHAIEQPNSTCKSEIQFNKSLLFNLNYFNSNQIKPLRNEQNPKIKGQPKSVNAALFKSTPNNKVKSQLMNPQQFSYQSQFYKFSYKQNLMFLQSIRKSIKQIDQKILSQNDKKQFMQKISQIILQKQKVSSLNSSKHHFQSFLNDKATKSIKQEVKMEIDKYFKRYQDIIQVMQRALLKYSENDISQKICKMKQQDLIFLQFTLYIIQKFHLMQFHHFFLSILLKTCYQRSKISLQQGVLCFSIIKTLNILQYKYPNKILPFSLQRKVQDFYRLKLGQILQHNFSNLKQDKLIKLQSQFRFMHEVQKLLLCSHLTQGKIQFAIRFIQTYKQTISMIPFNKIKQFIFIFKFTILQCNYCTPQNIKFFQTYLLEKAQFIKSDINNEALITRQIAVTLINIYQQIGNIPEIIHQYYISNEIYKSFSEKQFNFAMCLKYYVYSDCHDRMFLRRILDKALDFEQKRTVKSIPLSYRNDLHTIFHYLSIKKQRLIQPTQFRNYFQICSPSVTRNQAILQKMIATMNEDQSQLSKSVLFMSPCISQIKKPMISKLKSKLSQLQQQNFKPILTKVIEYFNSSSQNYFTFEQRFSFCCYQIDFVLLKWKDSTKSQLLEYMAIQCVGIQYSYDNNKDSNLQIKKYLNIVDMSLVEYQKNLILNRKKVIRQQILKNYRWKVLYISNKFIDSNYFNKDLLHYRLIQAINQKFQLHHTDAEQMLHGNHLKMVIKKAKTCLKYKLSKQTKQIQQRTQSPQKQNPINLMDTTKKSGPMFKKLQKQRKQDQNI